MGTLRRKPGGRGKGKAPEGYYWCVNQWKPIRPEKEKKTNGKTEA